METNQSKKTNPTIGAPKNFLIPILLLHLREWNAHGYELIEKLTRFGIDSLDHGNFYRILRQLEKDSLVTSVWDTTSGGPAKRIYSITDAGEKYLDMWAGSLSEYQKMLNQFFNLYNPFNYTFSSTPKNKVEKEPTTTNEQPAKSNEDSLSKTETNVDVLEEISATTVNTTVEEKPKAVVNTTVEEQPKAAVNTTVEEKPKAAVKTTTTSKPAAKRPTTRRTTKPKTQSSTKPTTSKDSTNSQSSDN